MKKFLKYKGASCSTRCVFTLQEKHRDGASNKIATVAGGIDFVNVLCRGACKRSREPPKLNTSFRGTPGADAFRHTYAPDSRASREAFLPRIHQKRKAPRGCFFFAKEQ